MGHKQERTPGLTKRQGVWHIDKRGKHFPNGRLRESSGETELKEAEKYLARRIEEFRNASVYGIRKSRTFNEAAEKYVDTHDHKDSIDDDIGHIRQLMPFIGNISIDRVHDGTLESFVLHRQNTVKNKTINNALEIVRHILNLAARSWRDETGKTWISTAPLITMLPVTDSRKPYPLSWDEQACLMQMLPDYISKMLLFKVNTGTREQEVCQLQWDWEVNVPEINSSVFLIPEGIVKNGEERLVILNDIAKSIIEEQRGSHHKYVFTYNGRPLSKMNSSQWRRNRLEAAMSFIEGDPDCDFVSEEIVGKKNKVVVKFICKRHSQKNEITTKHSTKDEDKLRKAKGLEPLTNVQIGKRPAQFKQIMRYKAMSKFIDKQWPEYSGFSKVRVHDLKHTFGRRLRAAGVSHETRKVLLGHKNGDITTHYGAYEIKELIEAAQMVVGSSARKMPTLTILKRTKV